MAVMTEKLRVRSMQYGIAGVKVSPPVRRPFVRPVMIVSVGLVLSGLGLVALMVLSLVPVTFLTAFLGFALTVTGGIMTLIFCGEI